MNRRAQRRIGVALALGAALITLLLIAAPAAVAQNTDDEIVYIDSDGVVRVFDPRIAPGSFEIQWFSPRGGYSRLALIDSDRDGDMEIAAARATDGGTIIDLYDPVIWNSAFDPGDVVGGVPWRLVSSMEFPGQPALLAAGNLDSSVPGAELLFVESEAGNPTNQRFYMLRNVGGNGSWWETGVLEIPGRNWNAVALGDMNGDTIDEIGLASRTSGTVEIWRLGPGGGSLGKIYENPNTQRPWHNVAMGDWLGNGKLMLGAVRTAPPPFPSFVVFRLLDNGSIQDYHSENFTPAPDTLFFGDVNDSGDDEVFFVRSVPATDTVRARLFARNRGSDGVTLIEDRLDSDNGYRIGVAGDFDADGRAEIAVLRNNNLRLYTNPESSTGFTSEAISSDTINVAAGDLDRNGHIQIVALEASPTTLSSTARSGGAGSSAEVEISNATNDAPLPITWRTTDRVGWLSIDSDSSSTPAVLTLRFDASRLAPGTYRTTLAVASSSSIVQNQTVEVSVTLVVGNGLLATPGTMLFFSDNCAAQSPMTRAVQLAAPANTTYTASLVAAEGVANEALSEENAASPDAVTWPSSVPWLTATSPQGRAPEAITLTADFANATEETVAQAGVVIIATVDGQSIVRSVPVIRMCVAQRIYAPVVFR